MNDLVPGIPKTQGGLARIAAVPEISDKTLYFQN